jgi:dipeptidase
MCSYFLNYLFNRITTHNDDCRECDFRISKVPAADWPAGSLRQINAVHDSYPKYMETADSNPHGPEYLADRVDTTFYNWTTPKPTFFLEQVPHTYGYTMGTYGIQNEMQVSIGESTCGAVFWATPIFGPGGHAVMYMPVLTELAMERCATALCAVRLVGDLSTQYGFYGEGWDVNSNTARSESGEALIISDPNETW